MTVGVGQSLAEVVKSRLRRLARLPLQTCLFFDVRVFAGHVVEVRPFTFQTHNLHIFAKREVRLSLIISFIHDLPTKSLWFIVHTTVIRFERVQ